MKLASAGKCNKTMPIYKTIKKLILDIIFPIECLGCGKNDTWLCHDCILTIPINTQLSCPLCHTKNNGHACPGCKDKVFLDKLLITTSYENKLVQNAIHVLKYNYIEAIGNHLGDIMANHLIKIDKKYSLGILENQQNTFLVPVPLHKKRVSERGFNQSEILASHLKKKFQFNYQPYLLKRKKYTLPQVTLKANQRRNNVKNMFALTKSLNLKEKNVIIIDDVATTLATLGECAKVLKQAGVRKVWGFVIARGG